MELNRNAASSNGGISDDEAAKNQASWMSVISPDPVYMDLDDLFQGPIFSKIFKGGISDDEAAKNQAFLMSEIVPDSVYMDIDESEKPNESVVADEDKLYSVEEIGGVLEHFGLVDGVDQWIRVTLNYGEMCPSQSSGACFKFQKEDEMVTFAMRSSDTLKNLREKILSHFDRHLAIEIQSTTEELILQSDGEILTFRDCHMYWGTYIKVILRAPPVDPLPEDLSKLACGENREIDVIVHAQGLPRFIIPVRLMGSIQDIKQNIKMLTAMDPEMYALCYKKKVLEDDSRVAMCKLFNNCCIQLVPLGKRITVIIDAIKFRSFEIEVLLMDSVQVIKQKIKTIISVDQEHQKLYCNDQLLPDNCIIACCGMYDKCQITCHTQAYESTSRQVHVSLCYGNFNLPLPSQSFRVDADSCLNVLKAKILENIESCLNLELPSGAIVKNGPECDISLANCQLSAGKAIKVLLTRPDTCTRNMYSTGDRPVKEMVIVRNETDQLPLVRFKLRMHPEEKVQKLKEKIKMICGVKPLNQKLIGGVLNQTPPNFTTKELDDNIMIWQICTQIEFAYNEKNV